MIARTDGQTLTARVLACMAEHGSAVGHVWTARTVAVRIGEDSRRVSRCLARLASRGEAVRRDCLARCRAGSRVYRVRVYRTTASLYRAAARRGILCPAPRVEDVASPDELASPAVARLVVDRPCCPPRHSTI